MPTFLIANWKAIVAAAAIALSFYAGWSWQGSRMTAARDAEIIADQKAQAKAKAAGQAQADAAGAALEKKLADLKSSNESITRRLKNETAKPAYGCTVPADGLRLLNEAIAARH